MSLNEKIEGVGNEPGLFIGRCNAAAGLGKIRKRLLDLTTRNRLLNFKWTKGHVLRIVGTPPDELFAKLLANNTSLSFAPVPEPPLEEYEQENVNRDEGAGSNRAKRPDAKKYAEKLGILTDYELSAVDPEHNLLGDGLIQTLLYPDDLEAKLRKLEQTARTVIEESGANMLYMVFGFLEWYDGKDVTKPLYAPLLVLPVSLKRGQVDIATGFFKYDINYAGEDISDNLTLREKLRQDLSLELPDIEEGDTPRTYFNRINGLISSRHTWKIHQQVTLTLLSFGKLLMYLDLAPSRWPKEKSLDRHELIKRLFEGFERNEGMISHAPEYPIDGNSKAEAVPLIYDADSSQHSALMDVLDGKDIVIEGPPGTGKSQTITNLIAASLKNGKTVLFVSEKLAALEVVRHRMDAAGLGMFCLELHSHKTQKRKLLDDIQYRLDADFTDSAELDNLLSACEERRNRLKRYADIMNSVAGNKLGLTIHQVLWKAERHRAALGDKAAQLADVEFPEAANILPAEMGRLEAAIELFRSHWANIGGRSDEHPWFGYSLHNLVFGDEPTVENLLRRLADVARDIEEQLSTIQDDLGLELPANREAFQLLTDKVRKLPPIEGRAAFELFPGLCSDRTIREIAALVEKVHYVNSRTPSIAAVLKTPDLLDASRIYDAREVCRRALSLNQGKALTTKILRRGKALHQIYSALEQSGKYFSGILEMVGLSVSLDIDGLRLAHAVALVAKEAPLDALMRNPALSEVSALQIAREAVNEGSKLQEEQSFLARMFRLSTLPPRDDIAQASRTFMAGGGWFGFLNANWRAAKRLYKGIGLQWSDIDAGRCATELGRLADFLDRRERYQNNPEYSRVLGDMFRGLDSDLQKIDHLTKWYGAARERLLPFKLLNGVIDVREIFNQPADQLILLQGKAVEVERYWDDLVTLRSKLSGIFGDKDIPDDIVPSDTFELATYLASLEDTAKALTGVGEFIDDLITVPQSPQQVSDLLEALCNVRKTLEAIRESKSIQQFLGARYKELQTDFVSIQQALDWCAQVMETGLPTRITDYLFTPEAPRRLNALKSAISSIHAQWRSIETLETRFGNFGSVDWKDWYGEGNMSVTPAQIYQRAILAAKNSRLMWDWASLSRSLRQIKSLALEPIVNLAQQGKLTPDDLEHALHFSLYLSVAKSILRHTPELMEFSGLSHSRVRDNFIKLDAEIIRLTGARCAYTISQRDVPWGSAKGSPKDYSELSLLKHELHKKKRHIPIRQMMYRAGKALQALKPCFMMGPLSVSQYLEPGKLHFDLVVMDEASQLRPEEALGAIARGSQIVVVGDPKQLPPTSFFGRLIEDDSDEEETGAIEGAECILDICQFLFQPVRTLRWHYRSQHESLIAFSNRHFYDNKLIVFPSPHGHGDGLGVRYHHVADGVYESRCNHREATRVADAVINHFINRKHESLGVVTLNLAQRDLIEGEIERRLKVFEKGEDFLLEWQESGYPFFVKNLENVQGDERDVIFISTTFGRGSDGLVRQRFGPINLGTGWRRLNVLFTRSRKRTEIFSSLSPEDIPLTDRTSRGAKALRDYLVYAKQRIPKFPGITDKNQGSDFEIVVGDVLVNHGYKIVPKLGVAGFFIDLAVVRPDSEGEFLAGIECDGATYYSGLSVRDRDRLRQQVLEGLGWKGKIFRIWSIDWFRDPMGQAKLLVAFLEGL